MQNPSLRLPPPQPSQFYLTPRGQTMAGSCLDAPGMEKPCTHRAPSAAAALTSAPGAPRGNAGSQGSLCPRADGVFLSHGLTPRAAQQPLLLFGGDIKKKKKNYLSFCSCPRGLGPLHALSAHHSEELPYSNLRQNPPILQAHPSPRCHAVPRPGGQRLQAVPAP